MLNNHSISILCSSFFFFHFLDRIFMSIIHLWLISLLNMSTNMVCDLSKFVLYGVCICSWGISTGWGNRGIELSLILFWFNFNFHFRFFGLTLLSSFWLMGIRTIRLRLLLFLNLVSFNWTFFEIWSFNSCNVFGFRSWRQSMNLF